MIAFVEQFCETGSNPDHPHLNHSVTTLISWDQIDKYLLPAMQKYNLKSGQKRSEESCSSSSSSSISDSISKNRFMKKLKQINGDTRNSHYVNDGDYVCNHVGDDQDDSILIYDYLLSRLDLSIHRELSNISTMNTLKYMFYHMKCGIFVMIRDNKVVIFCPFVNKDYKNTWGENTLKFGCRDGKKGVSFLCVYSIDYHLCMLMVNDDTNISICLSHIIILSIAT